MDLSNRGKKKKIKGKAPERLMFTKRWMRITRKIRIDIMSQPFRRYPYPNPKLYRTIESALRIPRSALRYKASKRILLMSKPVKHLITQKWTPPPIPKHIVSPASLKAVASKRILRLARPIKHVEKKVKKSAKQKKKEKLFAKNRALWIQINSQPKPLPPPPPSMVRGRKFRPLSPAERRIRIKILSTPVPKRGPPPYNPYIISRAAMTYVPTDRILQISEPKQLPEEAILNLSFKPFQIKKSALHYRITPKIEKLAQPKRKVTVEQDEKEDPFAVVRRALTAKCTKRTKQLAKPVVRE